MGYQDFISENEAANLAGVSSTTLSRFAEAGYIQTEDDGEGLTLYCKDELITVFGLKPLLDNKTTADKLREQIRVVKESRGQTELEEEIKNEEPVKLHAVKESPKISSKETDLRETHSAEVLESIPEPTFVEPRKSEPTSSPNTILERENEKLQLVNEMYEKLIEQKEREITRLEDQNSWLETRIERMEEKADRDQLLLLSETQLVRQMLEREQKPFMRKALEWLGVVVPEGSERATIELQGKSNHSRPKRNSG